MAISKAVGCTYDLRTCDDRVKVSASAFLSYSAIAYDTILEGVTHEILR